MTNFERIKLEDEIREMAKRNIKQCFYEYETSDHSIFSLYSLALKYEINWLMKESEI